MSRHTVFTAAGLACALLAACVRLPEPNSAPRPPASISASIARTWDAVIDQLGQQDIPLRSVERASGFIATQTIAMQGVTTEPTKWADCGTFASFHFAPTAVEYTILVRGDSSSASVRSSARYLLVKNDGTSAAPTECVSNGAFEASFDASVKRRAEARP
ncbi:MAG: hypothetical protein JWL61_3319 [Gemmatimonadetes bacterium]|jgi:hypothetical protein|nr:hypothetical protein [Gemmatimonadota bacterium]